jgi:hypothetical protein
MSVMRRSAIRSLALPDREMYAEHKAPRATPGGQLMNHRFRVGNWLTSGESSGPICRYNIIQIIIERKQVLR